ncbi:hypothetical protein ACWDWO_27960 [Actinopolymorpha singaporensis]
MPETFGTLPLPGGLHQLTTNGHRICTFVVGRLPGQTGGQHFLTGSLGVRIATIDLPGLGHQLTVNGHRAYTFVADRPGDLRGDRFITGSSSGRTYTWRAVRVPQGAPREVVFKPRK